MRDLIALRAKIDLLISECREDQDNYQAAGELMLQPDTFTWWAASLVFMVLLAWLVRSSS